MTVFSATPLASHALNACAAPCRVRFCLSRAWAAWWVCLPLVFGLLFSSSGAVFAATPLAQLEKKLSAEQKKATARRQTLRRLTEQERSLNVSLASMEKRILELEKGIASQQGQLLELGTADDSARKEYEALLLEQAKTEKTQTEALTLLWEITGKRIAIGSRDMPDWASTDREYVWTRELYGTLEGYRKTLDEQETRLTQIMGRRTKISRDMAKRLESINAEKSRLLKARVDYDRQLAQVRGQRTTAESELADILTLVENLNIEITQRTKGDIKRQKGKLPYPVAGKIRLRYAPNGVPPSRGLGFSASENAEVRAVSSGTVVHNDVLRGFGTVLILQHGDEYYTLYAFLGNSPLRVGQEVEGRQSIGRAGYYPAIKTNGLYFELRFKQKAINPEAWFAS